MGPTQIQLILKTNSNFFVLDFLQDFIKIRATIQKLLSQTDRQTWLGCSLMSVTWPLYHYICRSNLQKLLAFDQIMCLLFIWSTFLYFKLHSISIEQCLFKTAAWIKFKNNKFYYYSLLTCPPCFPRPYCLPSINPASQSVRMILSSSLVPLMYLIQASASARV